MNIIESQFAQMVAQHKSTIYTVCFMFSKHKEEVDDLFQEVLCNLWRGYGSFRGESEISTWVWRVAFNTCISVDRKRRRSIHCEHFMRDEALAAFRKWDAKVDKDEY